jgi:hypothetical protein
MLLAAGDLIIKKISALKIRAYTENSLEKSHAKNPRNPKKYPPKNPTAYINQKNSPLYTYININY